MTAQLVIDAFNRARRRGLIEKGAIIHTDRGSQYASIEYWRLVYINGFRQSMSGKGNCYDNAQAESFFSRFKAELVEAVVSSLLNKRGRKSSATSRVITTGFVGIRV